MANGFDVTYRMAKYFIDRNEIRKRIGAARVRALGRAGSFVRRRARTSVLRRRKSVSQIGQPPSVHSRDATASLRNILFFYDRRADVVVVGPVKLNQRNRTLVGNMTVPELLEFGGTVQIEEERYRSSGSTAWFRRDGRTSRRPDKMYRRRSARYRPRPFMRTALAAEVAAGTIPKAWAGAIRG